jgi:4a-hydroxytetrahydrobiopterin dehydratase
MADPARDEDLTRRHCKPCEGNVPALTGAASARLLARLDGWTRQDRAIERVFKFANFHDTMAFVNAVAWVAHREDHHPDLQVGYNTCVVRYWTHAIDGLSENDFICAAKVDALLRT